MLNEGILEINQKDEENTDSIQEISKIRNDKKIDENIKRINRRKSEGGRDYKYTDDNE
jgi:hypothetical protein